MKVLIINSVCGIRSTGRICTDVAEALEAKGCEVKIAYGRERASKESERFAVRIGSEFGVRLHGLKARLMDADGLGSRFATKRFLRWVKSFDPDVVHLNNLHGYYINVPMLMKYLAKSGKKVVWTLHDTWALTGHSGTCDYAGCERFETGCHHCPLTHGYPRSIVDRSARNYARKKKLFTAIKDLTIITPSDWLNGKVGRSYLKGKRIITVPNGVNTAVFKPAESDFKAQHGIADKMLIMGCASAWGKGKGLNDFVRLAEVLDDRFAIVMVGLTKEQIATMPQRIICVERTNSVQELARIYSAADLFVNLTYADVFSMVNREALCTGTPVLTYTTGGSAECINGKNGKAFAKGDLDAVIEYLSNTYCADSLDAGCLNDGDPCSKEDMANKYAEILQNKG